jgi:Family of unknown function (DUF6920)
MKRAYRRTLWVGGALVGASALTVGIGSWRWHAESRRMVERLAITGHASADVFTADRLAGLPEPVARYFSHVLRKGQRIVGRVDLEQRAVFVTDPAARAWRPLVARQHFTTSRPGFVWDARISMAPFTRVYVRDGYVDGIGGMRAALLGVYPVMSATSAGELNQGALQRYLAEAVWFPTALLPGNGLSWTAIDSRSALATLTDAETTVSLRFRFDDAGDVTTIFTSARNREVRGKYVPTPWRVRCEDYETHSGMRIPVRCTVQWELPDGPLPYWHGRITRITYGY